MKRYRKRGGERENKCCRSKGLEKRKIVREREEEERRERELGGWFA